MFDQPMNESADGYQISDNETGNDPAINRRPNLAPTVDATETKSVNQDADSSGNPGGRQPLVLVSFRKHRAYTRRINRVVDRVLEELSDHAGNESLQMADITEDAINRSRALKKTTLDWIASIAKCEDSENRTGHLESELRELAAKVLIRRVQLRLAALTGGIKVPEPDDLCELDGSDEAEQLEDTR